MATRYSLNLTADLGSSNGDPTGYFNSYSNAATNPSRCWVQTPVGSTSWSACNSGNNNSDEWGPTLVFSKGTPANCDQVQFQVYYTSPPAGWTIQSCNIYVSFATQGRTNAANQTASPFTNVYTINNVSVVNARCLLADTTTKTTNSSYYIGPYTVGINPSAVTGNPTINFEFSVVCSFVLQQTADPTVTQVYQFGYDPEMDLSIET